MPPSAKWLCFYYTAVYDCRQTIDSDSDLFALTHNLSELVTKNRPTLSSVINCRIAPQLNQDGDQLRTDYNEFTNELLYLVYRGSVAIPQVRCGRL